MLETPPERWRPPLLPNPGGGIFIAALPGRVAAVLRYSSWIGMAGRCRGRPGYSGTILDVGSGAQPYRPLVHPDATYMAIDTEAAKPHFGYEMPGTRYFAGDVWPVANASVDFILCTETLEHVLDTKRFLAEASRTSENWRNHTAHCPFRGPMALYSLRLLALHPVQHGSLIARRGL